MSGEQTKPPAGYVKARIATYEPPSNKPPQANAKPISKHEKQPKICAFPGYEQKAESSVPLVVPDNFEYAAGSSELKKVGKNQKRSKLVTRPEALELLKSIEKPIAVLTICGPARGGKSYLLSRILGRVGAFKLGHSMLAQTYGVWMGTHYLDFGDYAMVLLDTEGTDAVGAENDDDISILLLATLLSSYLIYNSMKVPTKNDLQTMECFTRLSSVMAINAMKESVQESEYGDLRRLFPDFLWLLRDVALELPKKKDGQLMTTREYMIDHVFESKREVGNALETFFSTVDCMALCTPGNVKGLRETDGSFQRGPNEAFLKEVKSLVAYIRDKARAKNGFQKGERVDGPTLSFLVDSYLKAINDPNGKPCIETSWKSAVQTRCSQMIAKLVKEYEDEMQKQLTGKLPMEVAVSDPESTELSLMQIHGDTVRKMLDKLREATQYFMPADPSTSETERKKLSKQLMGEIVVQIEVQTGSQTTKKVVGGVVHRFFEENEEKSRKHCIDVFDEVSQPLYEQVKAAESNPSTTGSVQEAMAKETEWLQADYFVKAVGPAKEEVFESKLKELNERLSRVAGFQQMLNEAIDREALAEKRRQEEIAASEAAKEELLKTHANEQKKMEEEHEKRLQRAKDDLEKQLFNEREKVKELEGKGTDMQTLVNAITQLKQEKERLDEDTKKQAEATRMQAEAAQKKAEAAAEAVKKQAEIAQKKAEAAEREAKRQLEAAKKKAEAEAGEAKKQAEAALKELQARKINLLDKDKKKIAKVWFGCIPKKDKVMKECKRLKLGAPIASFLYRSEGAWMEYIGERLYRQDLVELKKTYNMNESDILVHRK